MARDIRKNAPYWVYCWECSRGAYGTDVNKCSCGVRNKQKKGFNAPGCFCGIREVA